MNETCCGSGLWRTDGTAAGTVMVADVWPGACDSFAVPSVASGGKVYFDADDGVHGRELWVYTPASAASCATRA